ncbi:hypothetical protein WL18_30925 [Burkholderia ubonensis]|nr:hypothetical protein WI79_12980 [Burkholderia ubonensis]KVZ51649.1 hypothetical protein WL18_30925 [Burkholderia ubonensis]
MCAASGVLTITSIGDLAGLAAAWLAHCRGLPSVTSTVLPVLFSNGSTKHLRYAFSHMPPNAVPVRSALKAACETDGQASTKAPARSGPDEGRRVFGPVISILLPSLTSDRSDRRW